LAVVVKQYNVQEILIAISSVDQTVLKEVVRDCRATGVVVQIRPTAMPWLEPAMAR
jgi:FlaA1/EpsC-like NDP-sugar epimerase